MEVHPSVKGKGKNIPYGKGRAAGAGRGRGRGRWTPVRSFDASDEWPDTDEWYTEEAEDVLERPDDEQQVGSEAHQP